MLDFTKAIRKAQYLKAQMLIMQNRWYKLETLYASTNVSNARMDLLVSRERYDHCMAGYCLVDSDLNVRIEK